MPYRLAIPIFGNILLRLPLNIMILFIISNATCSKTDDVVTGMIGFEPMTSWLTAMRSTAELHAKED